MFISVIPPVPFMKNLVFLNLPTGSTSCQGKAWNYWERVDLTSIPQNLLIPFIREKITLNGVNSDSTDEEVIERLVLTMSLALLSV